MQAGRVEAVWLDEAYEISLTGLMEVAERCGLPAAQLHELVECGVLLPRNQAGPGPTQWSFSAECVLAVRTVSRLRDDFELDTNGMAVALSLLQRIRELERTLDDLHAQLPVRASPD
jgi:chaperone modulatory protein CbpM